MMKACQIQNPDDDGPGSTQDVAAKNARIVEGVISGLTHDALQLAMDIGVRRLTSYDGLNHLVDEMKKLVFPTRKLEAKELYAQGHNKSGVLSRQRAESMLSYINRRKRWWLMLKEMDPDLVISDEIRGDLLLEAASLSHHEQLMVLTSTGNDTDFDKVADALQKQHGKIHIGVAPQHQGSNSPQCRNELVCVT